MKIPAHAWAFGLAAITTIGAIVLIAIGKTVPSELWQLAFASGGAGAGLSLPSSSTPTGASLP